MFRFRWVEKSRAPLPRPAPCCSRHHVRNVIMCAVRPSRHEPFKTVMLVPECNANLLQWLCLSHAEKSLYFYFHGSRYTAPRYRRMPLYKPEANEQPLVRGALSYHIFAGPPNYEDVRRRHTEARLLLSGRTGLRDGDDFLNPEHPFAKFMSTPPKLTGRVTRCGDLVTAGQATLSRGNQFGSSY